MKKRVPWVFAFLFQLPVLGLTAWYLLHRHEPVRYPNFGIEIPPGYATHGIDVSRYQRCIDWEAVGQMRDRGQRISFAIAKATEGTNKTDPCFSDNWKGMREQQLLRGAYLYFHPNRSGKAQAEYFIRKVDLLPGDLAPVIDIEESNGMKDKAMQQALQECADMLEAAYHRKPILYTNVKFYQAHLGDRFNAYPLWAAHYECGSEPAIEREWTLWQHNCKGHVNGIAALVDFNVVNGGLYELKRLCVE